MCGREASREVSEPNSSTHIDYTYEENYKEESTEAQDITNSMNRNNPYSRSITWKELQFWLSYYKTILYTEKGNPRLSTSCPLRASECMHLLNIEKLGIDWTIPTNQTLSPTTIATPNTPTTFTNANPSVNFKEENLSEAMNVEASTNFIKEIYFVTIHRPSPLASISFLSPLPNQLLYLSSSQVDSHLSVSIDVSVQLDFWQPQKDGLWRISTSNPLDEASLVGDTTIQTLDIHLNHEILLEKKDYQQVRLYIQLVFLGEGLNHMEFWNEQKFIDIYFKVKDRQS